MGEGIIIRNIVIIGAILGVVFLSQQPFFKTNSNTYVYSEGAKNNDYLKKASDWFHDNVYPRGGGAAAISNPITSVQSQLETQKNNVLQNSFDSAKKFVAQETLNLLGVKPQDLGTCKAN